MSMDIYRKKIDELDAQLVHLLNERTKAAMEIGRLKQESDQEIYVPAREKAVMDRVSAMNEGPLLNESVSAIYREIMSAALALEHGVRIAYFGLPATFTHQAARSRFGASVEYVSCETIGDVFLAVSKKNADYGVVPIENSTEGAVTHTLDEFTNTSLKICAEISQPIAHHLMAKGPSESIVRVYSHPQVFGQCRKWLLMNMPQAELVPVASTSRAAEMAAKEPNAGALASDLAAEMYGLNICASNIQDLSGNTTRFLVVGKRYGAATGRDKTSIFFAVKHKTGALCTALEVFKRHELNMAKIESRPSKTRVWEYYFFLDIEGHVDELRVQEALQELQDHCSVLTVLGSYPRALDSGAEAES